MKLVRIESTWVNPEAVCRVECADANAEGFLTELVDMAGKRLFKTPPEEVARLLTEK